MYKRIALAALVAAIALVPHRTQAVVNTTDASVSYNCSGAVGAKTFTITYAYLSQSHFVVTKTTGAGAVTTLALTTDYTISPTSTYTSGTLTLVPDGTKCPAGSVLKIQRVVPNKQTLSLSTQGPYAPKAIESALDSLEMQIQQGGLGGTGGGAPTGSATGDLSGTYPGPIVTSTHLTGPLPQTQGGTGSAVALTCTAGSHLTSNGTSYACSADSGGSPTGAAGGNLGGTYPNPTVTATTLSTPLPQAQGGSGAGALTCTGTQHLSSNGTVYFCSADTGTGAQLGVINTWTAKQDFAPTGPNAIAATFTGVGTGVGLTAQGGNGGGGQSGLTALGLGVGNGIIGTGGASNGTGGLFNGGSANGDGSLSIGSGTGAGARGTGGASGPGVVGTAGGGGSPVRGSVVLTPQAAPSGPTDGDCWIETTSNTMKCRINAVTQTIYPSPSASLSLSTNNAWTGTNSFTPSAAATNGVTATGNTSGAGGSFTGGSVSGTGVVAAAGAGGIGIAATGGSGAGGGSAGTFTTPVLNTSPAIFAQAVGPGYGLDVTGNTTKSPIHMTVQAEPSSKLDGDVWVQNTVDGSPTQALKAQVNGAVQQLSNQSYAEATTGAGQSIPSGTTGTIVVFGTEIADTDGAYDPTTGRYTVATGRGGVFLVNAQTEYGSSASAPCNIALWKNGAEARRNKVNQNCIGLSFNGMVTLAAGDIIDIRIYSGAAGAITLAGNANANWITIRRMQ